MTTAPTLPASESSPVHAPGDAKKTTDKRSSSLRDRHFEALVFATFFTNLFLVTPDLAGELAGQMIPLMPQAWLASDGVPAVPAWLRFFAGTILALNLIILTVSAKWISNAAPIRRALKNPAPDDATVRRGLRRHLWRCHATKAAYMALSAGFFILLYSYSAERVEVLNALTDASYAQSVLNLSDAFEGGLVIMDEASISREEDGNAGHIAFGTVFVLVVAWLLHVALLLFPVSFSPERLAPSLRQSPLREESQTHPRAVRTNDSRRELQM